MRIRSIKPEFWRSPDVTALPIEDRLLFIGLWSYVDDNGVGRDELAALVGDLFATDMLASPRETVARVHRGLEHLEARSLVTRYSVDGRRFLHITTWEQHQRIDRPSKARYPGPDQADSSPDPNTREDASSPHGALDAGTGEQGNRGTGEQRNREQTIDRSLTLIDQLEPTVEAAFDGWWTHVRRKVSKPAAQTAFTKALAKIGGPTSAALSVLIASIEEHQRHWFDLEGRSIAKTPHPATWLNQESWNDELPPDDAYRPRGNTPATETPTERILRMRNTALAQMNGGDPNGNDTRLPRPALGSRVS